MKRIGLAVAMFLVPVCCLGRVITVDDDGPADFDNIQAAIDDSNHGDTVLVANGTYTGPGNRDIDFRGKAITVKSENGPADCIIDCQRLGNGFRFRASEGSDTVLDGFTVTNAYTIVGSVGIECDHYSSPTVTRCIVTRTSRGIDVRKSTAKISNCVTANNHIGIACVIYASPTITNCTVVHNSQSGIYCNYDSNPTVANSIVRGNGGGQIAQYKRSVATVSYSNVEGGRSGEGNIDEDPCFVSADYYRLMPGSACIDAGTNSPEVGLTETDLEGYPRPTDGDNDGQAVADMGAYESWPGDAPIIWLSHREFRFTTDEGGPNPPEQILIIYSTGNTTARWAVGHSCPWLIADPSTGISSGQGQVVLRADVRGLAYGEYSCLVMVSDLDGVNRPRGVVVNLHVGLPLIVVQPTGLRFVHPVDGPRPGPQNLSIWNGDESVLDWHISEDCNWLEVEPNEGTSTGEAGEVTLSADTSGLAPGMYEYPLVITANRASNSPYTVPVILHVGEVLHVPGEYGTIQAAINDSNHGDRVVVADGTYTGDGNRDIEFKGKAIIVRSLSGPANCIIDCNGSQWDEHRGFNFYAGEGPDSVLSGFTITNVYARLYCSPRPPFMCGPRSGAIHCGGNRSASPTIINCIMTGDLPGDGCGLSVGYYGSYPTLVNCTISGNGGRGIFTDLNNGATLRNCILWDNGSEEMSGWTDRITATYCDIKGGWAGEGNIDTDPCFADPEKGDYHLKSQAGRWALHEDRWTTDVVTSPCIDAGDMLAPIGLEPFPNGGIVNMGAYGATTAASKSYFGGPPCDIIVAGDINGDCIVDFRDFSLIGLHWMWEE